MATKRKPTLQGNRRVVEASLPEPADCGYGPFAVDTPGVWLVISDIHIPYHDLTTLELAAKESKRRGIVGILLNGDVLDSHEISRHDKDPGAPRYVQEIEAGRQFIAWLRFQFPKARIIFKAGNHDERLEKYVIERAPALFGLEGLSLPSLLHFADHGIEWVTDQRVITLGKLNVVHGHEYRGGGGVNPARWLYLRARSVAMAGHFHRTSEHHSRDIRGKAAAAWSTGCACCLSPRYLPINDWNNGFAFVTLDKQGEFVVDNRRVLAGKIV